MARVIGWGLLILLGAVAFSRFKRCKKHVIRREATDLSCAKEATKTVAQDVAATIESLGIQFDTILDKVRQSASK